MSIYILKKSDYEITAIYYSLGNICVKKIEKGMWGKEEIIASGVKPEFSVFEYNSDYMVIYQNKNGSMYLCGDGKEGIKILESLGDDKNNIVINAEIWNNQMELIYNLPDKNGEYIVRQKKRADSSWSKPEKIDDFVPFNNSFFKVHYADKNNKVIFYQKRMPEIQFGYREINENISNFKMVYATGYYITDYSYVITEDSIHFVFLLSGIYGSKIVYVRKESNKVSKAKTIVENTLARDCIIAIIQNKVCIWWRTARKLYSTVSYDMGESFKQQGVYKGKFETNSVKAVLVEKNQQGDKYIANEVYVPSDKPYIIELLPVDNIVQTQNIAEQEEIERLRKKVKDLEMRIRGK